MVKHLRWWVAAAFVLLAIDQVTKTVLPTEDWAWHDRTMWYAAYGLVMSVGLAIVFFCVPPLRLFAALCWVGTFGNALSALHSPIANPYVWGIVAFNTADVYLAVAAIVLLASIPSLVLYVRHALLRTETS